MSFQCIPCSLVFDSQTGLSNHKYCKGCFLDSGKNKIAKTSEYATAEIVAFSALVGDDMTDQVQMNDDNEECDSGGDEAAQEDNDYDGEEMMNKEEEAILPQVANKYDMFGIDDEDASIKDWMEDVVEDIVDSETENVQNITDVTEGNGNMNNHISSKSLLAMKANGLTKSEVCLEMNFVAGIELLAILHNSGASIQLYDKIVKWLEECIPHKLTESLPTRESIIKRMEVQHNLHCLAPKSTEVVLPSINLPIEIPVNPLLGCILLLLSDNNLMKSEILIFPNVDNLSQVPQYNGTYSEVNTRLAYLSYQRKIRNIKNAVQIPLIFFIDGTAID